ncbi:hypothetical protein J2Z31_005561 [Sinorhizobium kostiense]|uniref:Transposase n=1 Tax=Sinorhizobium kostiense TaxID=76747 RepID=A0ABS4R816_9HYPH|nr:hypothetical protein [Sinorhizobium kostiense]MBP2239020.1 hypothetical protein [Sinorhizobium kostiense]
MDALHSWMRAKISERWTPLEAENKSLAVTTKHKMGNKYANQTDKAHIQPVVRNNEFVAASRSFGATDV